MYRSTESIENPKYLRGYPPRAGRFEKSYSREAGDTSSPELHPRDEQK
jgi:hypothetical protein